MKQILTALLTLVFTTGIAFASENNRQVKQLEWVQNTLQELCNADADYCPLVRIGVENIDQLRDAVTDVIVIKRELVVRSRMETERKQKAYDVLMILQGISWEQGLRSN